jgi:hypothetical protein
MRFFSVVPKSMEGSMHAVEGGSDDDLALIPRKRAPNCNLPSDDVTKVKGGVDKYDGPDMKVFFLEACVGITRELCSLSLRSCSKETRVDLSDRTTFGGVAGKLVFADPETKCNQTYTI